MKKQILLILAAVLILSCGNKKGKAVNETDSLVAYSMADTGIDKHSEAYIRQRIDTIYKDVGKSAYSFNHERAYRSQRYYALMCEAVKLCNETGDKIREKAKALVGYWGWVGDDGPELLLRLEMTDNGLEVTECNIYRLYGFDKVTASFNGKDLTIYEQDYDEETQEVNYEFCFDAHLDQNEDLTGDCHIKHPMASKEYEGPLTLRKNYFKYRDGVKQKKSDDAE